MTTCRFQAARAARGMVPVASRAAAVVAAVRTVAVSPRARQQRAAAGAPTMGPRPVTVERELPDPFAFRKQNYYYFTCYGLGVVLACVFIFNYEKSSSPVITSVLYFLRRSEQALAALGDDINFAHQWPWIWGTLNTVRGDVDISFEVKGSKQSGVLVLKANRDSKSDQFRVRQWELQLNDAANTRIDLMRDASVRFGI
ncbi:Uncharacterized protein ABC855_g4775 [[Candida] zeylanoides]